MSQVYDGAIGAAHGLYRSNVANAAAIYMRFESEFCLEGLPLPKDKLRRLAILVVVALGASFDACGLATAPQVRHDQQPDARLATAHFQ